jgi:hypothetical protein
LTIASHTPHSSRRGEIQWGHIGKLGERRYQARWVDRKRLGVLPDLHPSHGEDKITELGLAGLMGSTSTTVAESGRDWTCDPSAPLNHGTAVSLDPGPHCTYQTPSRKVSAARRVRCKRGMTERSQIPSARHRALLVQAALSLQIRCPRSSRGAQPVHPHQPSKITAR